MSPNTSTPRGAYVLSSAPDRLPPRLLSALWAAAGNAPRPLPDVAAVSALADPPVVVAIERGHPNAISVYDELVQRFPAAAVLWFGDAPTPTTATVGSDSSFGEQERRSLALAAANMGVWDWDLVTGQITWDERMHELYGLEPGTFDGSMEHWNRIMTPEVVEETAQNLSVILERSDAFDIAFRANTVHNRPLHIRSLGYVHRGPDGQPTRMIGVNYDISEHVRAQEERERLLARVAQTQRLESIGALAAGIAHDFNNLIATISGNARFALETPNLPEETRFAVQEVAIAARRARGIVDGVLGFSRPTAPTPRAVLLVDVLRETHELVRSILPPDVIWHSEVPVELAVLCDVGQLQQALLNLITNALHAIGKASGKISWAAAANPADAAQVALELQDSGPGISADLRERVFEPFFSTKAAGAGTGLGLASARTLLRAQSGDLELLESKGGARFRLTLPAASMAHEADAPEVAESWRGTGERVLIADDDESIALLVGRLLRRYGMTPDCHLSRSAALDALTADPEGYALVIVDQNMPGGSAADFVRQVRRVAPKVRVAVASGHFQAGEAEAALNAGALAALSKPATVEEFGATIRRLLSTPNPA